MATWHQRRAMRRNPSPLFHATQWSVVTDPPGGLLTVMRFASEESANTYAAKVPHSLVLAPSNKES